MAEISDNDDEKVSVINDRQKWKEEEEDEDSDSLDNFDFSKKKKKKKIYQTNKKKYMDSSEDSENEEESTEGKKKVAPPPTNNEKYSYGSLVDRFYDQLYKEYPSRKTEKVYTIPPPKVFRHGGRAVIWGNFPQTCKSMKRDREHVKAFFLRELSAIGSLDVKGRFMIKGKYTSNNIEIILKKYIREYVACRTCKKPDTVIYKKNRLVYVKCNLCYSEKTVTSITK